MRLRYVLLTLVDLSRVQQGVSLSADLLSVGLDLLNKVGRLAGNVIRKYERRGDQSDQGGEETKSTLKFVDTHYLLARRTTGLGLSEDGESGPSGDSRKFVVVTHPLKATVRE